MKKQLPIFFFFFLMNIDMHGMEPSHKKLLIPLQKVSYEKTKQNEKEKYLNLIIESKPEINRYLDYSIYTPQYFKDLNLAKKQSTDPKIYEEKLKSEALIFINYVAANQEWPNPKEKLEYIEDCLGDDTLLYLKAAWDQISIISLKTEIPEYVPEKGTVEEVSEEEPSKTEPKTQEKTIEEQPIKSYQAPESIKRKSTVATTQPSPQKETKPEEPSSPGFLSRVTTAISQTASFVWHSITGFITYIYNFFSRGLQ